MGEVRRPHDRPKSPPEAKNSRKLEVFVVGLLKNTRKFEVLALRGRLEDHKSAKNTRKLEAFVRECRRKRGVLALLGRPRSFQGLQEH